MLTVTADGIVLAHVVTVGDALPCNALGEGYGWGVAVRMCGGHKIYLAAKTKDEGVAKRNEMIRLLQEFWKTQEDA